MSCLEVRHLSGCQITSCILSAHYSMYKHASFVATAPKEPCHTGGPREGASGRHVLACQRKQSKPRGSTLAGFMRMEEVQDPEPSNPIDPQDWKKSKNRVAPEPVVLERHEIRPPVHAAEGMASIRRVRSCHDYRHPSLYACTLPGALYFGKAAVRSLFLLAPQLRSTPFNRCSSQLHPPSKPSQAYQVQGIQKGAANRVEEPSLLLHDIRLWNTKLGSLRVTQGCMLSCSPPATAAAVQSQLCHNP
eukprot:534953-Pelagomonas_calceolata.AAC.1